MGDDDLDGYGEDPDELATDDEELDTLIEKERAANSSFSGRSETENDELAGVEGLRVVSQVDFERSIINQAEEAISKQATEDLKARLGKINDEIKTLEQEQEKAEKRLSGGPGSIRQIQAISARLFEIPKLLRDLRETQSCLLQRLPPPLPGSDDPVQELAEDDFESHSLDDKVSIGLMTPFGTTLSSTFDPLKTSLLKPKKAKKKEVLGTSTRADLAYCRSLKPGKVVGETHSMPRDVNEDSDEYVPESDECDEVPSVSPKKRKIASKNKNAYPVAKKSRAAVKDDGDLKAYKERLQKLHKERVRVKFERMQAGEDVDEDQQFEVFPGGYKISKELWDKLYHYQQITVRWLWELKGNKCGGIIGDEMGLGKTVQLISFLAGLMQSKIYDADFDVKGLGPVLIVAPATLMHQWVSEFHRWCPEMRVAILHGSGSHGGHRRDLIHQILTMNSGVLITSYAGMVLAEEQLVRGDWHYVILDEGHKIRNPDSQATQTAKKFKTPHRIILSGSPLQNNLRELWSLFDFVFPGKLGTLEVFMKEFSVPITIGGYATASDVEVATAFRCAVILKDTIAPYMIRRMKASVQHHIQLPTKNEQVLFCKLTDRQRELYLEYLNSREAKSIWQGMQKPFVGLTILRKICNHPHLYDGGPKHFGEVNQMSLPESERFGYWKLSGKMVVLESLLRIWKKQNHKVLLFSQSRQMLAIMEAFVVERSYNFLKIDGTTAIPARQPLIAQFNSDPNIFVFLLTTRVGGLGVNLTGASRVVIFDPDWNPSTDTQARERAWRIGQTKHVTVYRLIVTGSIEEKIYHRQIFKQYLANRVLSDPHQRRFFKSNELKDLFSLDDGATESSDIFAGTGSEVKLHKLGKKLKENKKKRAEASEQNAKADSESTPDERKKRMMELAKRLSQQVAEKHNPSPASTSSSSPEKTKKRKFAKVDGERVTNVVKRRPYKPSSTAETLPEENIGGGVEDEDDYVLRKLFKRSGVHAALRHDKIVNETAPDHSLIEGEAERLAQNAVEALRRSRHLYSGMSRYSEEATKFKPRFGKKNAKLAVASADDSASSAGILAKAQERNKFNKLVEQVEDGEPPELEEVPEALRDLLDDVRTFVAFGTDTAGEAKTSELLGKFKKRLKDKQVPVFRALLNKVCEFRKTDAGGVWYLRGEFR